MLPIHVVIEENSDRIPGRCPVRLMRKKRKQDDLARIAATNKIASIFKKDKDKAKRTKNRVKNGHLTDIIK